MRLIRILLLLSILSSWGCSSSKNVVTGGQPVHEEETLDKDKPSVTTQESEEEIDKPVKLTIDEEKETVSIISVIEALEESYKVQDFEKWKILLSPKYREKYSNPDFLNQEGWNATDIESFFYLLIETRLKGNITALPISRVEFIKDDKALVYVMLGDKEFPEPQHTFIRIENNWYKGLREEGE